MKRVGSRYQKYIAVMMSVALTAGLCGCAAAGSKAATASTEAEQIELVEPVGGAASYDVAQHRDIYQIRILPSVCVPAVTEFGYTTEAPFDKYGKLPGEDVKPGDIIVYGNTKSLDEEKMNLTDTINEKIRDYEDNITDLQEDLYDARMAEWEAYQPYEDCLENKPEEWSEFFDMWAMIAKPAEGMYKSAVMAREQVEQSLKERKELFELELEYDKGRLSRMDEKVSGSQITANKEGTIVAINAYTSGDYIQKNTNVIAIGDMQSKVIHTEYVSKTTVNKAKDIYAVVDGKRYEVTYEVMEKEEYTSLKKLNDVVYSKFYLNDPDDEVPMGKFVSLIIVEDSRENVLAIPSDVIRRNGAEYYCYVFDGTDNVVQTLSVGLSDGMYTEVISGLSEGDKVLMENEITSKGKTAVLTTGSVSGEFSSYGMLYYPATEWISNPAKYGTSYIKEICVEQFQQVEAGQELAKIEVISEDVSVSRLQRKIQRQQERLNKLLEEKSKIYYDDKDRTLDRAIEARQKNIESLNKELAKLTEYSGVITLKAPYSGIVTMLMERKEGDLISYNEDLVQIANQSQCYVIVDDKESQLSYGNTATITYNGEGGMKQQIEGKVVSVYGTALSKQLNGGFSLIRIAEEDVATITKYGSALGNGGWSRSWFEIKAKIREINNVVLIPKGGVTMDGKNAFVKVKDEYGNISYKPFILGGSDQNNYWAVGGLSEGMEICLD